MKVNEQDLDSTKQNFNATLKFLAMSALGLGIFLFPLRVGDRTTIPFDLATQAVVGFSPMLSQLFALSLLAVGALGSAVLLIGPKSHLASRFLFLGSSHFMHVTRIIGLILGVMMATKKGPQLLMAPDISGVLWQKLGWTVGVVIPLGAMVVGLILYYGSLEFFGALMRPIMRPAFHLPGRSALDDLMSWLGPYAVGFYFTRKMMLQGMYTRRQAFTVATCFCTISIGFVAVIASTLRIIHLFPIIFATYFIVIYVVAALLVRMWPITSVPDTYVHEANPEPETHGGFLALLKEGYHDGIQKAAQAPSLTFILKEAVIDGLKISATILGSILTIGALALLVAHHTQFFQYLGYPLVGPLKLLGIPDPEIVATALAAGFTEVYVPALLAKDARGHLINRVA